MKVSSPYFDPEFDTLFDRMYGPKVSIENDSMQDCTVIKVDGVNRHGILLEVVQIFTDMNLSISKSYISADGTWFMDVFHVKDKNGNKIKDERVINYIQQTIAGTSWEAVSSTSDKAKTRRNKISGSKNPNQNEYTVIEMTGADRPGLFSEITTTLADLECNIVEAHAWSHNARIACVANISDHNTNTSIDDPDRLSTIEDRLTTVLQETTTPVSCELPMNQQEAKTNSNLLVDRAEGMRTEVEHRLHQLMLSVRDFDEPCSYPNMPPLSTQVSIEDCVQMRYSIVSIKCKDRTRLMFDCVCSLTDMQFVIFHASTSSSRGFAFQEYFIQHTDGSMLSTESDKARVRRCMEAALQRRVSEGVRVELCGKARLGLLSNMTRVLQENGLNLVRADVVTQGEKAVNKFYVRGISGKEVDLGFLDSIKREMGPLKLEVVDSDDSDNVRS